MGQTNRTDRIKQNNIRSRFGKTENLMLGAYILCYFLVSVSFLTEFPFVHSDESWLSGLTRNMMEQGDPSVTETFYNLKPRYPHAIKILFHLLQMPMLAVFQYDVFAFRLLSLMFGCVALILFYLLLKTIFRTSDPGGRGALGGLSGLSALCGQSSLSSLPFLGTVLLSVDVQFIYASHFARQEIILLCCIIASFLAILNGRVLTAGIITGLAIGLHPNSFLIGTMCAAMLIPRIRKERQGRNRWKPLMEYAGVTAIFAGFFVLLSLVFDRNFLIHYFEYGNSEFDVGAPVTSKLLELPYFFKKIWYGVSGTYYVPDIRFELFMFALAAVVLTALLLSGRLQRTDAAALTGKGIAGMLAGMVIIGRYNQTSIIFLFPMCLVMVLLAVDAISEFFETDGTSGFFADKANRLRCTAAVLLVIITAGISYGNISPWLDRSYSDYLKEISRAVEPDDKVLANLNAEYYFDNGKLLDYRNLSYLKDAGMSVEEYIKKNDIEYIILSDEMDLIYSQRPIWNMIYGNPRYLEELHHFLDQNCTLVHSFRNNTYGIRIVQYMNSDRDFTIQIFKVKDLS